MSETTDDVTAELQRLREHNKQLTAELKTERAEKKASQDALQAAHDAQKQWRDRWHEVAVIQPLEASLAHASAVPTKYLRAELMDAGILKMETDADGIERPAWFDAKGEPADLKDGIHRLLLSLHHPNIDKMILAPNIRGGGAVSSPHIWPTPKSEPAPAPTPPSSFGLR